MNNPGTNFALAASAVLVFLLIVAHMAAVVSIQHDVHTALETYQDHVAYEEESDCAVYDQDILNTAWEVLHQRGVHVSIEDYDAVMERIQQQADPE